MNQEHPPIVTLNLTFLTLTFESFEMDGVKRIEASEWNLSDKKINPYLIPLKDQANLPSQMVPCNGYSKPITADETNIELLAPILAGMGINYVTHYNMIFREFSKTEEEPNSK